MKTTINIMALFIGLGLNLNAQTTTQKNICVKVNINENGMQIKTDTSFKVAAGDSIERMFKNVNWDSIKASAHGGTITITEENGQVTDPNGNTFQVFILKKVEIKDLTSDDKKQLPQDVRNSINDATPFTNLTLAPNPTGGDIRITYNSASTEPLQIKVYDTFGKTVLTQNCEGLSSNVDKTISLSNLSKGIYFVQLVQGTRADVRKIVVN